MINVLFVCWGNMVPMAEESRRELTETEEYLDKRNEQSARNL